MLPLCAGFSRPCLEMTLPDAIRTKKNDPKNPCREAQVPVMFMSPTLLPGKTQPTHFLFSMPTTLPTTGPEWRPTRMLTKPISGRPECTRVSLAARIAWLGNKKGDSGEGVIVQGEIASQMRWSCQQARGSRDGLKVCLTWCAVKRGPRSLAKSFGCTATGGSGHSRPKEGHQQ